MILGYALHNFYGALEDLFEHIARSFENTIEDPAHYHAELLKRMKIDVHKVRPAFLSQASFEFLNDLRSFRHVFRHAYDYELDSERVMAVAEDALESWEGLRDDKDRFRKFLLDYIEAE